MSSLTTALRARFVSSAVRPTPALPCTSRPVPTSSSSTLPASLIWTRTSRRPVVGATTAMRSIRTVDHLSRAGIENPLHRSPSPGGQLESGPYSPGVYGKDGKGTDDRTGGEAGTGEQGEAVALYPRPPDDLGLPQVSGSLDAFDNPPSGSWKAAGELRQRLALERSCADERSRPPQRLLGWGSRGEEPLAGDNEGRRTSAPRPRLGRRRGDPLGPPEAHPRLDRLVIVTA